MASRAVLLAGLHPQKDRFAAAVDRYAAAVDWSWLLERAVAHKVAPLIAHRIAAAGTLTIPEDIRERFSERRRQAAAKHRAALRDLASIDDQLRRAGVGFALIKGPVLVQRIYDAPDQRQYFDLDIVVRQDDVDAAQRALETLGYRLWTGHHFRGFVPPTPADRERATRALRPSLLRFAHELAFVTEGHRRMPVDLHWQLMPRGRVRPRAVRAFEENLADERFGNLEVRSLDAEATFMLLAMHAWSNRPWSFALLHLCDAAWALQRLTLDPRRTAAIAENWGGHADLGRTLHVITHVFGVDVPEQLLAIASPPSARFRGLATAANLVDHHACEPPVGWARRKRDLDWGLAIGSLRATGWLLLAKYVALLRYRFAAGT